MEDEHVESYGHGILEVDDVVHAATDGTTTTTSSSSDTMMESPNNVTILCRRNMLIRQFMYLSSTTNNIPFAYFPSFRHPSSTSYRYFVDRQNSRGFQIIQRIDSVVLDV